MMKIILYAVLALFPLLSFARNRCDICNRDISLAKNASRCGGCAVRESFGWVIDCLRHPDKNPAQIEVMRRTRRLGKFAVWNLKCVNQWSPINIVCPSGEIRLDHAMLLSIEDNPDRIRIILKDAFDTCIGGEKGKPVKHRGTYVLDNLPICLPGRNHMTLLVSRCSVDSIEYMVLADDGSGRSPRTVRGIAKSGEITDFSHFH